MDEIQINDIISSMLYLSGYSDFSVAIKPYKKAGNRTLRSLPVHMKMFKKKPSQYALGNRKGL